jgi:hypothetical protein
MPDLRIFLSSTGQDLETYRTEVREAIEEIEGWTCAHMEGYGAVDAAPADHDRSQVARCDLLIGLIGLRHGSRPPGEERSFTECEYDAAVGQGVPRLMFVVPDDFPVAGNLREEDAWWQRQQAFRARVRRERVVAEFDDPDLVAKRVVDAISRWQGEEGLLRLPLRPWRSELDPPGALLRPECGIVPFHEREAELGELLAWTKEERSLSIRLYTGAGGMGKTRLAMELCRHLRPEQWVAGFLDHRGPTLSEAAIKALAQIRKPVLIVLDYAETARDLLVHLVDAARRRLDAPVRLLLLARGAGDWWEALKREPHGVGDVFFGPATQRLTLQPLTLTTESRRHSYGLAAAAFAEVLEKDVPTGEPEDYQAPWHERVLMLHMAALMRFDVREDADEDAILDHHLARERRFWESLAERRGLPPYVVDGMGRAMAAITLGGGANDEGEAVELIRQLKFFAGTEAPILHGTAQALHDSYPGGKWIEPVLPDLLGEHLVERQLGQDADELYDLVLGPKTPAAGA